MPRISATSQVIARQPPAVTSRGAPSGRELPLAVVELDDHTRALVHAIEVAGLEVVDAVRADHLLAAEDRVAQRLAERRRAGLALGARRGVGEHHVAVERIG